jgi:diadenylate cyclase
MHFLHWLSSNWQIPVEILLIAVVIYYILTTLQGSRGAGILRGIFILFTLAFVTLSFLARYSDMYRLTYLLNQFLGLFAFVLIIVFQPELRRGLIRIGQRPLFSTVFRREAAMIQEVVEAVRNMSENRIGALIAFEREIGLKGFAETGTVLDAEVTAGLLNTVFWPGSPLHDGAVIVSEQRVHAAGCLFPLTEKPDLSKTMGTRHRAGIGITEESDAVTLIVSEETGRVSIAVGGQLTENVAIDRLGAVLTELLSSRTPSRR